MSATATQITVLQLATDAGSHTELTENLGQHTDHFDVVTTSTLDEARTHLTDDAVDCVLITTHCGTDGIDLLTQLRTTHPDLPMILCAGQESDRVASDALEAGATDYLRQNDHADQTVLLANRIQRAVDAHRATKQATELQRVRSVIADINKAIVRADTREAIETAVCEIISDSEPYVFAWIGEHDPDTQTVTARTGAGVEQGYLETIEITTDERPTGQGPTGTALRTRECVVMQDILHDDAYGPWREAARARGYRASAAIPLIHDETLFGVLNVYAARPHAFDGDEQEFLIELGETIAYGIHSAEVHRERDQQMARMRALFEESPDMIDIHDHEGQIIAANPRLCSQLGYTREALVGKHVWDIDQDFEPAVLKKGFEEMGVGDRKQVDSHYQRQDGTTFPVEVHIRCLEFDEERRYVVISHDITKRKAREQKLTEQANRLEQFATVVAHDLRNPLTTAQGYLDLLDSGSGGGDSNIDRVATVRRALERMERIVEDMLWLAREGRELGALEPVALADVFEQSWSVVASPQTDEQLLLPESALGCIRADKTRLRQLLENLFGNAIEHAGPGVTVRVETLPDGFAIADDGPGIPADLRERIFEQGFSTEETGTGFGLYIAREIAEAHGWEIRATESESGGTRFEITGVATLVTANRD